MSTFRQFVCTIMALTLSMALRGSVDLPLALFPHLRLVLGGDVILGRIVDGVEVDVGGADPFQWARHWLSEADLALVNLESPLCGAGTPTLPVPEGGRCSTPRLRSDLSGAFSLAGAGVDLVSLANNHAGDCGPQGIADTLEALDRSGVLAAGLVGPSARRDSPEPHQQERGDPHSPVVPGDPFAPVFIERSGIRVAVFAATTWRNLGQPPEGQGNPVAYASLDRLGQVLTERIRVTEDRHEADLIAVSLHWGRERATQPDASMRQLAADLVDAGADLIWGHHSHTTMPMEALGEGLVIYGLGDLVGDVRHHGRWIPILAEVVIAMSPEGRWHARRIALVSP